MRYFMKKFSDIMTKNEFRFYFLFFNKELNYNKFLFFDFPLFSDKEFANEFSNILILNNYLEFKIFYFGQ